MADKEYWWLKWKPEKFLMAVRYFSVEEVGQYVLMLNEQAVAKNRRIPVELYNEIAKSDKVRGKFSEDEEGFYNEVMEATLLEREGVKRARSEAGKKGVQAKGKQKVSNCLTNDDDLLKQTYSYSYFNSLSKSFSKSNLKKGKGIVKGETIKEAGIPTWEEFRDYGLSRKPDVNIDNLKLKYEAWKEAGWKKGKGSDEQIKVWKTTLLNTLPHINESNRRRNEPEEPKRKRRFKDSDFD